MKRNIAVLAAVVLIVVGLVWAGLTNHRRRAAEEAAIRDRQISLIPSSKEGGQSDDDSAPPDLRGKKAPGFTLNSLDGKKLSFDDLKGKPVLINFWATWCAPCKIEMPWFEQFHKQYEGQGLQIVGIVEDDAPKETVQNTVQKTGVTYAILHTDNKVDKAYGGIDYLPSSFFIDRNGTIVAQTAGLASKDEIEANIRKIVAQ